MKKKRARKPHQQIQLRPAGLEPERVRASKHVCEHPGCVRLSPYQFCGPHRRLARVLGEALDRLRKRPER